MYPQQRAYVSGYISSFHWHSLYADLPRDLLIFENPSKSRMWARRTDPHDPLQEAFNWSGEMGSVDVSNCWNVVPIHIMDMDPDRSPEEAFYLFEQILAVLESYSRVLK
jgi:hypothetical protein